MVGGYSCGFWLARFWLGHIPTPFGVVMLHTTSGKAVVEQEAVEWQVFAALRAGYAHEMAEELKRNKRGQ